MRRNALERATKAEIPENRRRLATGIAVTAILIASVAFAVAPTPKPPVEKTPHVVPTGTMSPTGTPTAEPTPAASVVSGSEVTRGQRSKLYDASRVFLKGYVPYTYGRPLVDVHGATPELMRNLRDNPPRPTDVTDRGIKVQLLQADTVGSATGTVRAFMSDGKRQRYVLQLELVRVRGRWLVSAVSA